MGWERRTSGIWTVSIDPRMPERDVQGYNALVDRLTELPMASRYRAMASRPFACFEAVNIWQKLGGVLQGYQLGDQWFKFDRDVQDDYGFQESGQDMLQARLSNSGNLLIADVAGYLFGFPYEEMLVAAGSLEYLSDQVTRHYSERYPGLVVTARR